MNQNLLDDYARALCEAADSLHVEVHADNTATKDNGEPMRYDTRRALEKALMQLQGVLATDMKRRVESLGEKLA